MYIGDLTSSSLNTFALTKSTKATFISSFLFLQYNAMLYTNKKFIKYFVHSLSYITLNVLNLDLIKHFYIYLEGTNKIFKTAVQIVR